MNRDFRMVVRRKDLDRAVSKLEALGERAVRRGMRESLRAAAKPGIKSMRTKVAKESGAPLVQLIDLSTDLSEQNNLAADQPNRVTSMRNLLDTQIARGRSTPGAPQKNDAPIDVEKRPKK